MNTTAVLTPSELPVLDDIIDNRTRLHVHAVALIAVLFLGIYGRLVCPFLNDMPLGELVAELLVIFAFQLGLREGLHHFWPTPLPGRSVARHGYFLSVLCWLLTGAFAMALNAIIYPDFPLGSHFKLATGYWILGGGLLAQWEFIVLEDSARRRNVSYINAEQYLDRLTRRIAEGYGLFTFAPTIALLLMIVRYEYEGLIQSGVVGEIVFLGAFCIITALIVAFRFGLSLHHDAQAVVAGARRVQYGERGVVLDSSRLDEIGEMAASVNGMCRELERQNADLEARVAELSAMSRVSDAMISTRNVDEILDLVMDHSRELTHAQASSLLLFNPDRQTLRFHVVKGSDQSSSLRHQTLRLGQGIAGTVAASGETIVLEDAYQHPQFDAGFDERTGFKTRSLLTVPIPSGEEIIGVVQVINKCEGSVFDDNDVRLLETLAAQAGTSLSKAKLYEDTLQLAEDLRTALEAERRLTIEKTKMGAYLPKNVVDEISRSREEKLALGGRTVAVSVLFSDIKGFTALSETLDPQQIVAWLNTYMTAMADVIAAHGGTIDKFMGDGIMAVFTSNPGEDHHALRAVKAGVAMQRALAELRQSDPTVAHLSMRVGINTGEVVAGNIGSETRMDYTVIGDNVNVASRIEGTAEPDTVAVSESTWSVVENLFSGQPREPIKVKNRQEPVKTWQISA